MDAITNGQKLKVFAEAYGVAVRAGCITPNLEDEKAIRKMFGLPDVSNEVVEEWRRTNGVRAPITIDSDRSKEESPLVE